MTAAAWVIAALLAIFAAGWAWACVRDYRGRRAYNRRARAARPGSVTFTLVPDTSGFEAAIQRVSVALRNDVVRVDLPLPPQAKPTSELAREIARHHDIRRQTDVR